MNIVVNGHNIFLIIAVCFISSLIFVYISKKIAEYLEIYDIPNERLESVFSTPNTSSTTSSSSEENTDEEINYFAIG